MMLYHGIGGSVLVIQNTPRTSDPIQALLAEYDACYMTLDHFDSMQWTIGSIFIVGVLNIFRRIFPDQNTNNPRQTWRSLH